MAGGTGVPSGVASIDAKTANGDTKPEPPLAPPTSSGQSAVRASLKTKILFRPPPSYPPPAEE